MEENRKIKQIPLKYSNDRKEQEQWWNTPEGIDEFEKYINSNKCNDVDSRSLIPMDVIEKFLNEGEEDFQKDLKEEKRAIKTVGDLKEYLKDKGIPDDAELFFYFPNSRFYTEDLYKVNLSRANYKQLLVVSLDEDDNDDIISSCQ